MTTVPRYEKDPQDVIDYGINWQGSAPGPWLAPAETITASSWTVPTGIVKDSDTHDATTTTVWLHGGTAGVVYTLTNHVTTSAARQVDGSIEIKVRDK